ncbi:MAG: helix-turn-helix transcriptional regulator [Flavobacterium sp.]|uniref:response regulator transcription factor n=1 Tax=Flavobacterium sp. TaxID=239 RepID=UPI0032673432
MNILNPLSVEDFNQIAKNDNPLNISNYEEFFQKQIDDASNYAVGSYFWFIGNNHEMKIVAASRNINELTPFSHEKWTNGTALFLVENLHPDDSFYVLSALNLAVQKIEELPTERQSNVRVNIYARMLNSSSEYRWVLIQMPNLFINKVDRTTCGIIMITDLSHLSFKEKPILMTLTDKIANKNIYFNIAKDEMKLVNVDLPNITKREQEILKLMAKGLNSPEIAKTLFLSYHTIENHKRNMRKKTNSKTSAELINYVWSNNLL